MSSMHFGKSRLTVLVLSILSLASLAAANVPAAVVLRDGFDVDTVTLGVWTSTITPGEGSIEVKDGSVHFVTNPATASSPAFRQTTISRALVATPAGFVAEVAITQNTEKAWAGHLTILGPAGSPMSVSMVIYANSFAIAGHVSPTERVWKFFGAPAPGERFTLRLTVAPDGVATMEALDAKGGSLGSGAVTLAFGPAQVSGLQVGAYNTRGTQPPLHISVDEVTVEPLVPATP